MKKTINFDAFAQFADARLSKEEMKMIKGGTNPEDSGFEGGNHGGGSGTGGGDINAPSESFSCYGVVCGTTNTGGRSGITIKARTWADALTACQTYWGNRNVGCAMIV